MLATILLCLLLLAAVAGSIRHLLRLKKEGRFSCGCGTDCAHCTGDCRSCGRCKNGTGAGGADGHAAPADTGETDRI